MTYRIDRRAFLRGAGTVAIGLPFLEIMAPASRARADGPVSRFLVCFGGVSTSMSFTAPSTLGAGYDLTPSLAPLAGASLPAGADVHRMLVPAGGLPYASVIPDVTVVSNLTIPWAVGGAVPPGGRVVRWHSTSTVPLLTGTRALGSSSTMPVSGPSSEQIVGERIRGTAAEATLELRVQADSYYGPDGNNKSRMSYRRRPDGTVTAIDPIASPRVAFTRLFGTFVPPDADAEAIAALRRRRSVLDSVRGAMQRLVGRLGGEDRARLAEHLERVRDLERLVDTVPEPAAPSCRMPADPGADPAPSIDSFTTGAGVEARMGYADEELRAETMTELLRMAFACDRSRAASLMYTFAMSHLNVEPLLGYRVDAHSAGHQGLGAGRDRQLADVTGWHVKQFARLVDALRSTPDGDGTLLDNTVAVLHFEGGWGRDPETGNASSPHSSEKMICLVAGGAAAVRHGTHVDGRASHPASVTLAAMRAVGVDADLGDVREPFSGLV